MHGRESRAREDAAEQAPPDDEGGIGGPGPRDEPTTIGTDRPREGDLTRDEGKARRVGRRTGGPFETSQQISDLVRRATPSHHTSGRRPRGDIRADGHRDDEHEEARGKDDLDECDASATWHTPRCPARGGAQYRGTAARVKRPRGSGRSRPDPRTPSPHTNRISCRWERRWWTPRPSRRCSSRSSCKSSRTSLPSR